MFDVFTGWKIGVESTEAGGSYVIVSPQQVEALCRVLAEHRVPHAVEGHVPILHHADAPSELVVRLGAAVEVTHVQGILDLTP